MIKSLFSLLIFRISDMYLSQVELNKAFEYIE